MTYRVLIAYASKHGSTTEIARKVGEVLTSAGLQVNIVAADRATDVAAYDAVVLGSAVYEGQWCKEAVDFLETNKVALTHIPVWLFSSGPMGKGDPETLMQGWHFPTEQTPVIDRIHARDTALFNGVLDLEKLSAAEKRIVQNLNVPEGDFRNWDAIRKWAVSIVVSLRPEVAE